jgi:predicted nucleotidyltransferase
MNAREAKHQPKDRDLELAREYARRLRERLGDNLVAVTLYGSRARGDAREGSDFDLIVRVRERTEEVRELALEVDVEMMNEFDELFVGVVYDEVEWKRAERFPFGWNIKREGLPL